MLTVTVITPFPGAKIIVGALSSQSNIKRWDDLERWDNLERWNDLGTA